MDRAGVFTQMCRQRGILAVVMTQGFRPDGVAPGLPSEKTMQGLTSQFRSFNAELIHCHDGQAAVQAIPAGNRAQIPCLLTLHLLANGDLNRLKFAKSVGTRFTIIAVCRSDFESLKESGIPEADIHYVPNGTASAARAGSSQVPRSHRPNLIFVGSVQHQKGVDVAILAMAELKRRRGQSCPILNIYGGGEKLYYDYYKEMAEVLGLRDVVRFCGVQPGVLERCPGSDILIVPSRAETGPLVVLEAMSRGMPIVATDVGEVTEMLPDRRYGRIVPVNSITALADAVESLLSEIADGRFDPDLLIDRHRLFHTIEKMAENIDMVYQKVLLNKSLAI
jgi:glycosyltransferase involved in cell wall biosynthesis